MFVCCCGKHHHSLRHVRFSFSLFFLAPLFSSFYSFNTKRITDDDLVMEKYLKDNSIWQDEGTIRPMFSRFKSSREVRPRDWDRNMNFWKEFIISMTSNSHVISVSCAELERVLTRRFADDGAVFGPNLAPVMHELMKEGKLRKKEDYIKKFHQSWASWTLCTVSELVRPLLRSSSSDTAIATSSANDRETELVVVPSLKIVSENVMKRAFEGSEGRSSVYGLVSMPSIDDLSSAAESILLVLQELETGLNVRHYTIDNHIFLKNPRSLHSCNDRKIDESVCRLLASSASIEAIIDTTSAKIADLNARLRGGNCSSGLKRSFLVQRKNLDNMNSTLLKQFSNIQGIITSIQTSSTNIDILHSLKLGKEVLERVQSKLKTEDVTKLLSEIQEISEDSIDFDELLSSHLAKMSLDQNIEGDGDHSIEQELAELENELAKEDRREINSSAVEKKKDGGGGSVGNVVVGHSSPSSCDETRDSTAGVAKTPKRKEAVLIS